MDISNINSRQQSIGLTIPRGGVIVVGCGGVGSWTAYMLALAGVETLYLFDSDIIELHNLNRIPLPSSAVGQYKSKAVADLILSVRPTCNVLALGMFTEDLAQMIECYQADWMVVTTDTHASRKLCYNWASDNAVKYIEAAAEGDVGSATGRPAEWATPEETQPGYASVPVWIGPSVISAYLAVSHVLHNTPLYDRVIRMGFVSEPHKHFHVFDKD